MNELYKAYVKAQSQIKGAVKDSTNPHFKSKYANMESVIEAIKEPLAKNGLAFIQPISSECGKWFIKTILIHESGFILESGFCEIIISDMTNPQKFGSSLTYFRRYSLMSFFGIPDMDDDGNTASQKPVQAEVKRPINHAPQLDLSKVDYKTFTFNKGEHSGKRFCDIDPLTLSNYMKNISEIYVKAGNVNNETERVFELYNTFIKNNHTKE